MTANVFKEDVEKCLAAGMDDHVGKPLDMKVVLEKMRKYMPGKARGETRAIPQEKPAPERGG
jgi:CheY-like chemotaxis protein